MKILIIIAIAFFFGTAARDTYVMYIDVPEPAGVETNKLVCPSTPKPACEPTECDGLEQETIYLLDTSATEECRTRLEGAITESTNCANKLSAVEGDRDTWKAAYNKCNEN